MVKILNEEPHKSVIKEDICRKCGVTLSYVPMEVKEGYTSDYLGDRDYYKYIVCPNCKNNVRVKS